MSEIGPVRGKGGRDLYSNWNFFLLEKKEYCLNFYIKCLMTTKKMDLGWNSRTQWAEEPESLVSLGCWLASPLSLSFPPLILPLRLQLHEIIISSWFKSVWDIVSVKVRITLTNLREMGRKGIIMCSSLKLTGGNDNVINRNRNVGNRSKYYFLSCVWGATDR